VRSWADQVPTSSGLWQQGDQWVVWRIDGDGVRHTSHPMPYPLAREKLTEWRNGTTGGNRSGRLFHPALCRYWPSPRCRRVGRRLPSSFSRCRWPGVGRRDQVA